MFWSAIQIALLVYLGLAAIMFFRQSSLVFLPEMDRGYGTDPSDIGLEYTSLKLRTLDGETLDGWHVPATAGREKRGLSCSSTATRATSVTASTTCACSMTWDWQR
jgi:hypothetical protein